MLAWRCCIGSVADLRIPPGVGIDAVDDVGHVALTAHFREAPLFVSAYPPVSAARRDRSTVRIVLLCGILTRNGTIGGIAARKSLGPQKSLKF